MGAAEGEAIIFGIQHSIDNKTPFIFFPCGGGQRMFESPIALSQMTRTTLAVNELKKNNLPYGFGSSTFCARNPQRFAGTCPGDSGK